MPEKTSIAETAIALQNQFELSLLKEETVTDESEIYQKLVTILSERLRTLIDHEFERFVNILYRIDVNENAVKEIWQHNPLTKPLNLSPN